MGHVPIILCAPQRDIACEELLEADGVYGLVEFRCGIPGAKPYPKRVHHITLTKPNLSPALCRCTASPLTRTCGRWPGPRSGLISFCMATRRPSPGWRRRCITSRRYRQRPFSSKPSRLTMPLSIPNTTPYIFMPAHLPQLDLWHIPHRSRRGSRLPCCG